MEDDKYRGKDIISLFKSGLDTESLVESFQEYYEAAEERVMNDPDAAIKHCNRALKKLESSTDLNASYSRGKFHLLVACISLNDDKDLKLAMEQFLSSRNEFSSMKWSQLEALAYLGLAITQRKLGDLKEAVEMIDKAISSANLPTINVDEVALVALRDAIMKENKRLSPDFPPKKSHEEEKPTEKQLSIYNVSAGQRCVAEGGTADLNLLSHEDYQYDAPESPEVIIDLTNCPEARYADYILEVDSDIDTVKSGLNKGDWLLIKAKTNSNSLRGKRVAVLTKERSEFWASLKTFAYAEDHYFLKAQSKDDISILIAGYKSQDLSKISDYYEGYGQVEKRFAYYVQVTGEVIKRIPRASIKDVTKPTMWRIPILSNIAAGVDVIIEDEVEDYLDFLDKHEFGGAHFGVRVVGDSMKDFGILSGDIALIQHQKIVEKKDFTAVVIRTPEMKEEKKKQEEEEMPLSVLKQYYLFSEESDELRHVLLMSGNPLSEHLLVMESGVNVEKIQNYYTRQKQTGKIINQIQSYKDAELEIAGKCVGLVRKDEAGTIHIFHNIKGHFQPYLK